MISRRRLIACAASIVAAPLVANAQPTRKAQRIGVLIAGSSSGARHFLDAFQRRLSELGYVDGQQVVIEARWGEGRTELFPRLVAELTQLKVAVLVVGSDAGALAAKNAATSLPVVFTGVSDPVALGLVSSLGRPGGHMTGVALAWDAAFGGKWLELLKELVPRMSRAAMLWSTALGPTFSKSLQDAGKARGVTVEMFQVTDANRFGAAFAAMSSKRIEGLIVIAEPLTVVHRTRIAELAATERLPTVAGFGDFPRAGGLMGYGVSLPDIYAQAAVYVDKILKGAKPADLPVEQPTKLELVINAKTAKALGLTIPSSLRLRADQVIE